MAEAHDSPDRGAPARTDLTSRRLLGRFVTGLGIVGILWGVLHVTSAGYGTEPGESFAQRRSYNMVKRDVHSAFPGALLRALVGGALLIVGARMRRVTREE